MNFAEHLRDAREACGLSSAELAEKINSTPDTVAAWESGDAYPQMFEMKKLSRILKTDADLMISDEEMDRYISYSLNSGSSSYKGDLLLVLAIVAGLMPGFMTGNALVGAAGVTAGVLVGFLLRKLYHKKKG